MFSVSYSGTLLSLLTKEFPLWLKNRIKLLVCMYVSVFLHTCKNIHWGAQVWERWMCASIKREKDNRMYCRNMIYLVESIGVTFSLSRINTPNSSSCYVMLKG